MHSALKGFMDARMLWPEDAEELIKLTNGNSHSGRARRPVLLDKLREKVNRLGLKPNDGHDLEGPVRGFLSVASKSLQLSCVDDFYPL